MLYEMSDTKEMDVFLNPWYKGHKVMRLNCSKKDSG